METIQVVIDKELLRETDRIARERRVNRSALVRDALRAYLRRQTIREREQRDREGYQRESDAEFAVWDPVTAWPDE